MSILFYLILTAEIFLILFTLSSFIYSENIIIELLSHFSLQYLFAGILSFIFVLFIFGFKTPLIIIPIITILINFTSIFPYLPMGNSSAEKPDLKILQANVLKYNKITTPLKNKIEAEDPDIIIIDELTLKWGESLEYLKEKYPYQVVRAQDGSWGMGIYSKYELSNIDDSGLSDLYSINTIICDVKYNDKSLKIISIHPPPPMKPEFIKLRNQHFDNIIKITKDYNNPLIVIGDMNVTMYNPAFKRMLKQGNLQTSRLNRGIKGSWPVKYPSFMRIPIDHLLYNKRIQVLDFKLGKDIKSDHLPTITNIRIK